MDQHYETFKRAIAETVNTPELSGLLYVRGLMCDSTVEHTSAMCEMFNHIDVADLEPVYNAADDSIDLTTIHAGRNAIVARYFILTDTFEVL